MRRRDFVTSVLVAGVTAPVIGDSHRPAMTESEHAGHQSIPDHDRRNNHAVSFGNWSPSVAAPLDRMGADPNPRTRNGHFIIPSPVRVLAGDTVSFIISGFHNVLVYGPDTQPADIDRTNLIVSPPMTFPPLINDPDHRVYRGLDPRSNPAVQDRVEVVAFNDVGRFLVMCGVLPHFFDSTTNQFVMFGYVEVNG